MRRPVAVLVGALSAVVAIILLGAGASKLAGTAMSVAEFERWGYPDSLRPVVGAVEILMGVLLLVPATRLLGAVLVAPWLVVAIYTHIQAGEPAMVLLPLAVAAMAMAAAWLLRPRTSRPEADASMPPRV